VINYDVLESLFDTSVSFWLPLLVSSILITFWGLYNFASLFFFQAPEKSPKRSKTETDIEKKKEENKEMKSNEHENGENEDEDEEDEEEGNVESYDMKTDFQNGEKFYEEDEEEEEDGNDFGLYWWYVLWNTRVFISFVLPD